MKKLRNRRALDAYITNCKFLGLHTTARIAEQLGDKLLDQRRKENNNKKEKNTTNESSRPS